MSSSDPQRPVEPEDGTPPGTREVPATQPTGGASAAQSLPPHPGAITPAPVRPVDGPAPTGPVDFVPGPPGAGTPPPPPPVRPTPPGPAGGAPQSDALRSDVPRSDAAPPKAPAAPPQTDAPTRTWPETLDSDDTAAERSRTTRVRPPRDRRTLLGLGLAALSVVLLQLGLALRWDGLESSWEAIPLWSAFATGCALLALAAFLASAAAGRLRAETAWRTAAGGLVGLAAFWLLVVLPVVATDRGFLLTAALAALGGALWTGPRDRD
ncbi:hypothetical protein [Blastococcus tunisiensis]|uniref:Uncharacterized protein n=1 Tax=Blastococcus tunisiensis TaxID=1798228 RepID=A0A1I2FHU8_9ACTN|nr:hypothetical protein [Blastococcus sp. DSM 46838]SFF04338.1 hypothetical protein SAMN05216574_108100 [Blastococcus sp. DSM 46838]